MRVKNAVRIRLIDFKKYRQWRTIKSVRFYFMPDSFERLNPEE